MNEEAVVSVKGLVNRFGKQVVHQDLDLELRKGEILGVIGGSGSGKSVLLRSIIGLNRPAAGEITVLGVDVLRAHSEELARAQRRWGVLFQDGALFSSQTVAQNIQAPLREHLKLSRRYMDEIASLKISLVGLSPEAGVKHPSELSGGMRKRAGLARALAMDPELLVLDEPTAGLDPIGAAAFDELLLGLSRGLGLTVFLVTHDLDTLYAVCDRVAVLAEKKIYAVGTIDELLTVDHPWIREYFHGPRGRNACGGHAPTTAGAGE